MRNKDQVRTFDCCCERDGEPWRAWQRGVTGPDFSCIGLLAARGGAGELSSEVTSNSPGGRRRGWGQGRGGRKWLYFGHTIFQR